MLLRCESLEPPMSQLVKFGRRGFPRQVCFTPNFGHCSARSARQKSAKLDAITDRMALPVATSRNVRYWNVSGRALLWFDVCRPNDPRPLFGVAGQKRSKLSGGTRR